MGYFLFESSPLPGGITQTNGVMTSNRPYRLLQTGQLVLRPSSDRTGRSGVSQPQVRSPGSEVNAKQFGHSQ